MPRAKKDPKEEKRKIVTTKVAFGLLLGLLILATNAYVNARPQSEPESTHSEKNKTNQESVDNQKDADESVLGLTSEDKERIERVGTTVSTKLREVDERTKKVIEDGREQIGGKANDLIYNTTIKPIIDRFEALPDAQKESIRESVCTDPSASDSSSSTSSTDP